MTEVAAVLDATALLAFLFDEAGSAEIESVVTRAAISGLSLAEATDRLVRAGVPATEAGRDLAALGLVVVPLDAALATEAAALQPLTRYFKLSLAARVTLALAKRLAVPAWTTDKSWTLPKVDVAVRVVG